MFIKRENRTGKAYASFKKLVAYNFFYKFTPDNCVRCEAVLVGYDSMPDIVPCLVLIFSPDDFINNRRIFKKIKNLAK